jgi:hypothetical protein
VSEQASGISFIDTPRRYINGSDAGFESGSYSRLSDNPYLYPQSYPNGQRTSVNPLARPLPSAWGGLSSGPTPTHTANPYLINPELSRGYFHTPPTAPTQNFANPPQRVSPVVPFTQGFHQTRQLYASTSTPTPDTGVTPTILQSAWPSHPRTPANPGFSTQALGHCQAPQSMSSDSRIHYRPNTAANTSATPTSVQSASPSLPQTPANLSFLIPTKPLDHHRESQSMLSGS